MSNDHLPVEVPELVGTTGVPDIHSDFQESNTFSNEGNTNRGGGGGRRSPQLMWSEGEEYYEDPSDYDGPTDLVDLLLRPPTRFPITILPAVYTTLRARQQRNNTDQNRTQILTIPPSQNEDSQDLGAAPGFIEDLTSVSINLARSTRGLGGNTVTGPALRNLPRNRPIRSNRSREMNLSPIPLAAPTFLNTSGEIDLNLIPHAPRTDLPPPPPLVALPRLTEAPPASGVWRSSVAAVLRLIYVLIFLSLSSDKGESIMDFSCLELLNILCRLGIDENDKKFEALDEEPQP
ncbi:hypothetical protein B9Z19DRAFT_1120086 [Tuber borchii]|uniref:Uncharacterized protein n=1 Tax=Tuber borchii TaxID=42251 RepID=A0A2T7A4Z9_TUBBO|nr:hypothetical protein B9Z19DRAFT_1120086 [Tuber borchii]